MSTQPDQISVAIDEFTNDIVLTFHVEHSDISAVVDNKQAREIAAALLEASTRASITAFTEASQVRH